MVTRWRTAEVAGASDLDGLVGSLQEIADCEERRREVLHIDLSVIDSWGSVKPKWLEAGKALP